MQTENLILKNLSASYEKKVVLKNVSFEIKKGEFMCLCGPNGSGKSTLLSILAGLQNSTLSFQAEILPEYLNLSRKEIAKQIAFLSQTETSTWDFSVRDVVLSGRYPYTDSLGHYSKSDYEFMEKVIHDFHIEDLAEKSIFQISGGELQKARIARCFAQNTNFLLLDEPLTSLDIVYENHLMQILKDKAHTEQKGILISVHDLNLAIRYADKIILLPPARNDFSKTAYAGESLFCDIPDKVITLEKLQKTYGVEFEIKKYSDGDFFVRLKK